jgi:hypothetical protein
MKNQTNINILVNKPLETGIPRKMTGITAGKTRYPFDKLLLGESFDLGIYDTQKSKSFGGFIHYYNKSRKNIGKHFVSRKVEETDKNGKTFFMLKIFRDK